MVFSFQIMFYDFLSFLSGGKQITAVKLLFPKDTEPEEQFPAS